MTSLGVLNFCLIASIAANLTAVRADSASELRERKVDAGEGVSLRAIEAGRAGPGRLWSLFPAGARAPIFGDDRSITLLPVIA
jgi:hypothetical protein